MQMEDSKPVRTFNISCEIEGMPFCTPLEAAAKETKACFGCPMRKAINKVKGLLKQKESKKDVQ